MDRLSIFKMAAAGALMGALTMIGGLVLARLSAYGVVTAILFTAAGGAVLTLIGSRWHEQSIKDDATGLYNRRYLFRRLAIEHQQALRDRSSLGLAVIDVDDFRSFNNKYGHLTGDAVLLSIAETICKGVRKGDFVGRWGGEEFAVVLPGADEKEALAVAERIRRLISELAIDTSKGEKIKASISAGVASLPANGSSLKELVMNADAAMYTAKRQKNKVVPFKASDAVSM